MAKKRNKQSPSDLPGSLYQRNSRWWWKVQLPREDKTKARPLKPVGSRYATTDYAVAVECAKQLLAEHLFQKDVPLQGDVKIIPDLVRAYMDFAREYYVGPDGRNTREPVDIKYAMKVLMDRFPSLPVDEFGPLRLKEVREDMIDKKWCRNLINRRIGMIRRMFKWAVSEQLVSPMILHGLQAVTGLRRGRSRAKESKRVLPVDTKHVYAVLAHTTPVVAAMGSNRICCQSGRPINCGTPMRRRYEKRWAMRQPGLRWGIRISGTGGWTMRQKSNCTPLSSSG